MGRLVLFSEPTISWRFFQTRGGLISDATNGQLTVNYLSFALVKMPVTYKKGFIYLIDSIHYLANQAIFFHT